LIYIAGIISQQRKMDTVCITITKLFDILLSQNLLFVDLLKTKS